MESVSSPSRSPLWKNPYVLVVVALLVLADIVGIVHSFRAHSTRDGIIAIAVPPFGLYRAVELLSHRTGFDVARLSQSQEGRQQMIDALKLKSDVWDALLLQVTAQEHNQIRTKMQETGVPYDIIAIVPPTGPVTLTVQSRNDPNLTISMIDTNRDQALDALRIVKKVNGKSAEHMTPIENFSTDDASQFLLAWSLAWGTIAEEQKAAALPTSP